MTSHIPQCGIDLIHQFEGCELTAYRDGGGKLTIGIGHCGSDVYEGLTITQDIADMLLKADLESAQNAIDELVTVAITDNQDGALLSFCYNLGRGNFAESTLLKLLNAGDYDGASKQFPHWSFIDKIQSDGLLRRRLAEQALFDSA